MKYLLSLVTLFLVSPIATAQSVDIQKEKEFYQVDGYIDPNGRVYIRGFASGNAQGYGCNELREDARDNWLLQLADYLEGLDFYKTAKNDPSVDKKTFRTYEYKLRQRVYPPVEVDQKNTGCDFFSGKYHFRYSAFSAPIIDGKFMLDFLPLVVDQERKQNIPVFSNKGKSPEANTVYTSLVIDAKGKHFGTSVLFPVVYTYSPESRVFYYQRVDSAWMKRWGNSLMFENREDIGRHADKFGDNPLIVKAEKIKGNILYISTEDALKIEAANEKKKFLEQCRIGILR